MQPAALSAAWLILFSLGLIVPRISFTAQLLLIATFSVVGCGLCDDEVVQEIEAPEGGAFKALVFVRNCGATTDYASSVCLVSPNAKSPQGNAIVFTADSNHGAAPSLPNGALPIAVVWVDSSHLRLIYDSRVRVFRSERLFSGIHIEYSPKT